MGQVQSGQVESGQVERRRVAAAGPWVSRWGYSRAVRVGDRIEVSGTTGIDAEGNAVGPGDPYAQARAALEIIRAALAELGGTFDDVVRTRVFLRNVDDWQAVGRAHAEAFGAVQPASTCVGGLDFLSPDLLVEIEATAVLG